MADKEFYAELKSAQKAADESNKPGKDDSRRKNPWRYLFAAPAAYGGAKLLGRLVSKAYMWLVGMNFMMSHDAASIGIIGGADGPTAIFVTTLGWIQDIKSILFVAVGIYGFLRLRKRRQK